MTVSEWYKVLEVMVKENPQGEVYFRILKQDDYADYYDVIDASSDDVGDLMLR